MKIFSDRRQQLLQSLPDESLVVIPAAKMQYRNRDVNYRFRQNSHFLYLTGFTEPDAILLLSTLGGKHQALLFCQPFDAKKALWDGPMLGVSGAQNKLEIAQCYALDQWTALWQKLAVKCQHFYSTEQAIVSGQISVFSGDVAKVDWLPIDDKLARMRMIKSSEELASMQRAIDISVIAHRQIMTTIEPGVSERELYGNFLQSIYKGGADEEAYLAIVATGGNACILHYIAMQGHCREGELLLLDGGAEFSGYAADLTRTFPVSGRFGARQKVLYEHVLHIQEQVIASINLTSTWLDLDRLTTQLTIDALLDMGLLTGSVDENLDKQSYQRFAPHRIGHWLGLDVHDVGVGREVVELCLPEHATITVEPGIYISPEIKDVDEAWLGLGVRIEDDVLLTGSGAVVMSKALEKSVEDIEALMAH